MKANILAILLLSAGIAHAEQVKTNIAYGPDVPSQMLDLYRPLKQPAPLVVYVHGGDWSGGGKGGANRIAHALNAEGFAVAGIDYRLLPGASIQDEAADVARATAFLMAHAYQYGIDPRRFALAGHSSGGHLVALVGTDPSYARQAGLDISRLSLVIPLDGVFDLATPFEMRRMKNKVNYDEHVWQSLSPIDHLQSNQGKGGPAFCLLHEDEEPRFISQADSFAAALRTHGRLVEEDVVPGLTHVELAGRFDDPSQPTARIVVNCLKHFLGS
jgi:arylformamidase